MGIWREEDHPRDASGRFTDKDGFFRQNTSYSELLKIPLAYFSGDFTTLTREDMPKEAYGFLNKERLNTADHRNHAKKMGYKNQKEYERAAIDFWKNGKGTVYSCDYNKRFYKYDCKTEEFISIGKDGTIYTFYYMTQKDLNRKIIQEGLNTLWTIL